MIRVTLLLGFSALLVGCGISKEKYTSLEDQLKTSEGKVAEANSGRQACEAQLSSLTESTTELEEKTKTYEDLVGSLQDEIKTGKVNNAFKCIF